MIYIVLNALTWFSLAQLAWTMLIFILLFVVVFFQRKIDNRVNEIFTDWFKYVKLHIYLPCQQSLYNNCSSFASFFTDTIIEPLWNVSHSWYCFFFALIIHKGISSKSWGLTRTKFPTFTALNDVHGNVNGSHILWPIVREDDWILYVNNFKCVEQSNFNMSSLQLTEWW